MNDQSPIDTNIVGIPLQDLTLSPLNARQTVPDADIASMSQSISVLGLLQNLVVFDDGETLGVVAGGKRLRGLQALAIDDDSPIGPGTLVPCQITEDINEARRWAIGENETRSDPSPADQICAYRDLQLSGADTAEIARAFGTTERHVQGRLALAKLPDSAISALRNQKINLDEAKALTMANDQAQAERVLESALTVPNRSKDYIRSELTEGRIPISDRRAVFVGLELYLMEGGQVTEDLFTDDTLLHSVGLLDELFAKKLALKTAEIEQDEGWSWATAINEPHVSLEQTKGFQKVHSTPGELSDEDRETLYRLRELDEVGQLETASVTDPVALLEDLERRLGGDFEDADRERAGVICFVNRHGRFDVSRAWARPGVKPKPEDDPDAVTKAETKPKPPITAKGETDLHAIATLAMQAHLITKPELLLDLLCFQLEDEMRSWEGPLNVTLTPQKIAPSTEDGITTDARLIAEGETKGRTPTDRFIHFQSLGKKHRNTALARHLTRALNAPFQSEFGKSIFAAAGVELRKVWTPTAENFFSNCSPTHLAKIWAEALDLEDDDTRHAEFAKLTKGKKAQQLEELFSDASVQEAHGLSRDQIKALDFWVPEAFRVEEE